jgi:hypothetical protein
VAADWSSDLGLLRDNHLSVFFKMAASCFVKMTDGEIRVSVKAGTPPGTPRTHPEPHPEQPGTLPGTPGTPGTPPRTLPGTPATLPGTPGTPPGTRWNTSYEATHVFLYKFTCFALNSGCWMVTIFTFTCIFVSLNNFSHGQG